MVVVLVARATSAEVMKFVLQFLELAPFSPFPSDVPFSQVPVRGATARALLLLCESLKLVF